MGPCFSCPQRPYAPPEAPDKGEGGPPSPRDPAYWGTVWGYYREQVPGIVTITLERYMWTAYAYSEDYMAAVFFGQSDYLAWLAFALTAIARPLGGLVFGCAADHLGRRAALLASLYIMLGATLGQGLAPTVPYLGAGWLLLCRFLLGVGEGVGIGSYAVMAAESAPAPVLAHSAVVLKTGDQLGFVLGLTVAKVTQHLFTPAQMLSWGWRIPFLLAALPGMVSICVAHTVHESAEFEEKHTDSSESLFSCMQEGLRGVEGHWRAGLLGICGTMAASCYLYVTAVYWREWLVDVGDQTPDTALSVLILGQLFTVVAQVPVAVLGDTFGIAKSSAALSVFGIAAAVPTVAGLYYFPHSYASLCVAGVVLPGLSLAGTCLAYPWCAELFPMEVRAGAFSFYYNISASVAGLSPFFCSAFRAIPLYPGYYSSGLFAVTLAAFGLALALHSRHKADPERLQVAYIRQDPY